MTKALFIVAPELFRDEEYFQPKQALEEAGIEVVTASTVAGELTGKLGGKAASRAVISQVDPAGFDAVVFIGGAGSRRYYDDPDAHRLARYAADPSRGMLLAAICSSAGTLARAGVLKDKKATVFSGDASELAAGGAQYTATDIEQDGNIITASGPHAATGFGKRIAEALTAAKR